MIAEVIASTNRARDEEFLAGLATEGYLERFLPRTRWTTVATEVRSRLGNTTHISVMDAEGACASVTCSNGSCSGVVVPGTGMHLNNMLGEEDLNPLGYHLHEPGRAGAEHDGADRGAARRPARRSRWAPPGPTGSARRSSRRSSAWWTTACPPRRRCARPRIHVEGREVEAEPGIDEDALDALERADWTVRRWAEQNLFFGGVQAVARNPRDGRAERRRATRGAAAPRPSWLIDNPLDLVSISGR